MKPTSAISAPSPTQASPRRLALAVALALATVAGCAQPTDTAGQPPRSPFDLDPPRRSEVAEQQRRDLIDTQAVMKQADPAIAAQPVVHVTLFPMLMPVGTVSRSEPFWKRLDEQVLDPATADLLYKNGFRVGRAPRAQIESYLKILETQPVQYLPQVFVAAGVKSFELPMSESVPDQILYDFDAKNQLTVRSYPEASDNLFVMELQQVPRRRGDVRVSICPMVRQKRKQFVSTGTPDHPDFEYRQPEKYFSLNFGANCGSEQFLVIAPSPDASPMSLGHAFLTRDGAAQRMERVILVIPKVMRNPREAAPEAPSPAPDKSEASVKPVPEVGS